MNEKNAFDTILSLFENTKPLDSGNNFVDTSSYDQMLNILKDSEAYIPSNPMEETNELLSQQLAKTNEQLQNQQEMIHKLELANFQLDKQLKLAINEAEDSQKQSSRSQALSLISILIALLSLIATLSS